MTPLRGRPPKQPSQEQQALERAIARRLDEDPDDPGYQGRLHAARVTRRDARRMSRNAADDWALDAYRTYVHLLKPDDSWEVGASPHVDFPDEIVAIKSGRRRLLPADVVAGWAFRRRRLGQSLAEVARAQVDYQHRPERIAELQQSLDHARREGDVEEAAYFEGVLALARWQGDADDDVYRSDDSIRKAIERNRLIWEVAEREHLRD